MDDRVKRNIGRMIDGGATEAEIDAYIASEKSQAAPVSGGFTLDNAVRQIAKGTPIGSYMDEAAAAADAATHSLFGRGSAGPDFWSRYAANVGRERGIDTAFEQANPKTSTALQIGGALASIPLAPAATIFRGAAMLPRLGNAVATGLGYGALYGAGEGDTAAERAANAGIGAGVGGAIGAAAAPVAAGVSNAVNWAANRARNIPPALQQYGRGAINRVSRAARDDNVTMQGITDMGPQGMLADQGPNLRGQVGAIARTPGEGQRIVTDALEARHGGAAGRINADINAGLGPPVDLPATAERITEISRQRAAPFYDTFHRSPVPFTPRLEQTLRTLQETEPGIIREAQRLSRLDPVTRQQQFFASVGPNGVTIERVPNAREWDIIKQALDNSAFGAQATPNDRRIYGHWSREIRDAVDEILSPGNPAASPWAQGRAISGEGTTVNQAIEEGRQAFSRNLSPDEMAAQLRNPQYGRAQQAGYVMGARQGVRDIGGNASTQWGENEATALRSRLGSNYAREKIDQLAVTPGAADRIGRRLDTETEFARTNQAATGNSVTAAAQAAQREFPNAVDPREAGQRLRQTGLTGMALAAGNRFLNAVTSGAVDERNRRIAIDAARMLVNTGADRNAVVQALMQYAQNPAMSRRAVRQVNGVIEALMQSTRPASIGAITAP